jgi:hypothetical protein
MIHKELSMSISVTIGIVRLIEVGKVLFAVVQWKNGNIPHWCKKPCPVVTSRTNRTRTASIAARPFQVSALLVQPHSHTITGDCSSLRFKSYTASSSSTLPSGTKDCEDPKLIIRQKSVENIHAAHQHRDWVEDNNHSSMLSFRYWRRKITFWDAHVLLRAGFQIQWEKEWHVNVQRWLYAILLNLMGQ